MIFMRNSLKKHGLIRRAMLLLTAAALFAASPSRGGEEDLYAELLRRSQTVNDELMKTLAEIECPTVSEYPDRVLSLRKNAQVTLGGEARATYAFSRSKWADPGFDPLLPNEGRSVAKTGDLSLSTAKLLIDVRAGDRWRAYFDLDLNGYHGLHSRTRVRNPNAPGQPLLPYERSNENDIIGQAYVELLKSGHSGFGLRVGRMKMPFGLWARPNLFAQSFMDAPDLAESYLMNPEARNSAVRLPHASRLVEPVLAALASYEMRDIIRFEAAVFRDTDENLPSRGDGRHEAESYAPRSWQVGVSLLPLEGWELTANFRNRYSRSRGTHYWADSAYRWDFRQNLVSGKVDPTWDSTLGQWSDAGDGDGFGSRTNEQSLIVGLAVEIPNTNLSARVEYAHGWNQGFNRHISSDSVSLGLSYRMTPFLTLHAQGDWLHVKDRSWMGSDGAGGWLRDTRNNHLYRGFVGAEYELSGGLTLEAGWQYEYWKVKSSLGGSGGARDDRLNTANMGYLGTRLVF